MWAERDFYDAAALFSAAEGMRASAVPERLATSSMLTEPAED